MTGSPPPLAILHVASHTGVYRGGAVQLCRMAAEQARRGHRVEIVANIPGAIQGRARRKHLATWHPAADAGIPVHALDLASLRGVWKLRKLAQRGFAILHAHRDEGLIASWLALWGMKSPALAAQRGTVSTPPRMACRAFASPRTRAAIAVAVAVRDALIEQAGTAMGAKTHVVYGSVDLGQFAPRPPDPELKRTLKIPDSAKIAGSLSAWRRDKGFEEILDALAGAIRKESETADAPPLYAVFLGRGVMQKVEPMARKRGIAERCRFAGHQEDVARWLSIMDLTIMAAHKREGLSGVLRESLAMEIPAITSDCAGNVEIVRDGETGLLVPVGDAAALERALLRTLRNPGEAKALARAGRKWVEENCSLAAQGDRLETIYRSLARTST